MGKDDIKKRIAFVLIDGVGDVSIPKFGYRTPLEVAKTPNLDAIGSAGVNGLMDPVEPGLACGSDTAHLSLLGYDPRVYYRGRGAFESMGAGIAMSPGDIAFKSNFATLDEKTGIVISRRADRHFEEEGPILCAALDGLKLPSFPDYEVRVRYATEHRCGVVVKGPKLSGNITGTDPLKDNRLLLKAEPLDDSFEAKNTAAVINELSKEITKILVSHPINKKREEEGKNIANVVLLRGCGIRIEVPSFEENHGMVPSMVAPTKIIAGLGLSLGIDILEAPGATGDYRTLLTSKRETRSVPSFEENHGMAPCMVAPTKIIAGLGLSLGIDILEAPGATGDYRTLLTSKAKAISSALTAAPLQLPPPPRVFVPGEEGLKPGREGGYDFGFLHIKAIDDAGHDKATMLKVRGLEAVDRAVGQLAKLLWQAETSGRFRYYLCVTGDHSTPVEYGDHSFEPVPFALCRLEDFVNAIGEENLNAVSLEDFPLPSVAVGEDLSEEVVERVAGKSYCGDSVSEFSEVAAARGCLGRFPGSEMMGVIKKFIKAKNE